MSHLKDKYILNSKLETDNQYPGEDKSNIYDESDCEIIHALKYIGKDKSSLHDEHQHSYIINGDLTEPTSTLNGIYNIWKIPGLIINNGLFGDLSGVDKDKANYFTIPFTVNQSPRAILSEFTFRGDTLKEEEKLDGRNPINYNYLHQNINAVVEFEDIDDINLDDFVIKHKKGDQEDVFRANNYFVKDQDNKYIFDINNILQKSRLTQFPGSIGFGGLYDTLTLTQTGDLQISEKGITMPMNSKILPKQGIYAPGITIHPAYEIQIQEENSNTIISPMYENNKINEIQNHELGNSSRNISDDSLTFNISSNFIIDPYSSTGEIFSISEDSKIPTDITRCWTFERLQTDKDYIISNQLKYIGDKCNFGSLTSETSECVLKPDVNIYINEQNQNLHNLEEIRCQFEKQPSQFINIIDEKGGETRVTNSTSIQLHMWDKNGSPKNKTNNEIPRIEVQHYNEDAFDKYTEELSPTNIPITYSQTGSFNTPYDYTQKFSADPEISISNNNNKLPVERGYIKFLYNDTIMADIRLMQDAGYSLFGLNVNFNIPTELNDKLESPNLYLAKITDSNDINLTDLLNVVSGEGFEPLKVINEASGLNITNNIDSTNYQCVFNLNDGIDEYFDSVEEGDTSKEFDYNGVYMIYMKTEDGNYLVPNYGIIYLNMSNMSITSVEEIFPKADGSEVENNQFDLYFSDKINENKSTECKIYKQYPIKIWLRHNVSASNEDAAKQLVNTFTNIITNSSTSSMKVSKEIGVVEITTIANVGRENIAAGEWDIIVEESELVEPTPITIWRGQTDEYSWQEGYVRNNTQYFYQATLTSNVYVPITSDGTPEPETLQLDELSYTNGDNTYTLSGTLYKYKYENIEDGSYTYTYIFESENGDPYSTDLNNIFQEPDVN